MLKQVSLCGLILSAGLSSMSAGASGAATYVADFTGAELPQGWIVENREYLSPEYSNAVDRIELRYSGSDAAATATIRAYPKLGDGAMVATLSAASSSASFDFPETTDFRSFRIAADIGIGLSSFVAYVSASALDAPSGVTISNNTTGTSFDATWNAVQGATGYHVYVWTNVVAGASHGNVLWQDTIPGAASYAAATSRLSDEKFGSCFEHTGWTRSDKAGYPTGEMGTIRIGTTSDTGWLQTPPIESVTDDMAVRFYAKAVDSKSDGKSIVVERISGESVVFAGAVALSLEMQEFVIPLSEWEMGDCIRFNSITNSDRRVIIGSVTVVSGYAEGHLEPSYIVNGLDVGLVTEHSFAGLPSVPVQFAVEAYGRRGVSSAKTEAVEVDLANPEKVALLNACPLSLLASSARTYTQNFDSLASLTDTSSGVEWLNGTTLPYWQAYCNGGSVGTLKWNQGTGTTGGLYALATNQTFTVRALGARATSDKEYSWGIAFTNDTEGTVVLSSVEYSAQQWGFSNKTNQALSVSAQVVDGLDWISAYEEGWTVLHKTESVVYGETVPQETPVFESVSVAPDPEISIAPGQVLMLKWTAEKKSGTPGMMGIDDVAVTFECVVVPRGFTIRLADNN